MTHLLGIREKLTAFRLWVAQISGRLRGLIPIKVYWHDKHVNFGDLLAPFLFEQYGLSPIHAPPGLADVVSAGSLLTNLPETYSGFILGAGLIRDGLRRFPKARIIAVRGELTRERIGAAKSTVLGDPGLLVSEFLSQRRPKVYKLGIVPHRVDKADPRIHDVCRRHSPDVILIDVQRQPSKVIADIDACEYILSSSLHGLVVADSLGIPNAWILLSDKVVGSGFKFYDYASAFGEKYDPFHLTGIEELSELTRWTHEVSNRVADVKRRLDRAFRDFAGGVSGLFPVSAAPREESAGRARSRA